MKKGIICAVVAVIVAVVAFAGRTLVKGAGAVGNIFTPVKN